MLLDKYLPRIKFDSYEDFKENYKVNVPSDFNFGYDIVDEWAKADKKKKALLWVNDHNEEKTFTFRDISRMSNKTANYLRSIGVGKGTVVMLVLRRRWEYWVCATAIHKLGAVLIPGSLQLAKKDIVYRVNSAKIHTIISVGDEYVIGEINKAKEEVNIENTIIVPDTGAEPLDAELTKDYINFHSAVKEESEELSREDLPYEIKVTDPMLVYFTSGTTGMPKMVAHDFSYPLGHIVSAKYWQRVQEDKLHMTVSDSGWAKFGWGKIYGQWICGAVIFAYDMDKFVPKKLLEMLEKYSITTFCAPPTMFRFMIQEDVTQYDLSSIKHCGIAGEPLNPEVFNKWHELTGLKLCEGFGQSETTVMIANFEWFEPQAGSTGKPSPLYDIELLDEDNKPIGEGEEGAISVNLKNGSPTGLFKSYYMDDEMTKKELGGDYYNTGDMAWRDNSGYYWFVGRNDDVIKCSGYRIGPFEVESALIEHDSVIECAITAVPDPVRGQIVKATIVLKEGYVGNESLIKELQHHVKKTTAPYKYPRIIEFVDELPKTLGGKIKRAEIRSADHKE